MASAGRGRSQPLAEPLPELAEAPLGPCVRRLNWSCTWEQLCTICWWPARPYGACCNPRTPPTEFVPRSRLPYVSAIVSFLAGWRLLVLLVFMPVLLVAILVETSYFYRFPAKRYGAGWAQVVFGFAPQYCSVVSFAGTDLVDRPSGYAGWVAWLLAALAAGTLTALAVRSARRRLEACLERGEASTRNLAADRRHAISCLELPCSETCGCCGFYGAVCCELEAAGQLLAWSPPEAEGQRKGLLQSLAGNVGNGRPWFLSALAMKSLAAVAATYRHGHQHNLAPEESEQRLIAVQATRGLDITASPEQRALLLNHELTRYNHDHDHDHDPAPAPVGRLTAATTHYNLWTVGKLSAALSGQWRKRLVAAACQLFFILQSFAWFHFLRLFLVMVVLTAMHRSSRDTCRAARKQFLPFVPATGSRECTVCGRWSPLVGFEGSNDPQLCADNVLIAPVGAEVVRSLLDDLLPHGDGLARVNLSAQCWEDWSFDEWQGVMTTAASLPNLQSFGLRRPRDPDRDPCPRPVSFPVARMRLLTAAFLNASASTATLAVFDFAGQPLGPENAALLLPGLAPFRTSTLDLTDALLTDDGVDGLQAWLNVSRAESLATLRLGGNLLSATGIARILQSIATFAPNLHDLSLADNKGDAQSLAGLADLNATRIAALDLSGTDLSQASLAQWDMLRVSIASSEVAVLDLGSTRLGDIGLFSLAPTLLAASNLTSLGLASNFITSTGLSATEAALTTALAHLVSLDLSQNPIGEDGLAALGRALNASQPGNAPYAIGLEQVSSPAEGLQAFVAAIAALPPTQPVASLSLAGNPLGAPGASAAASLLAAGHLTSLDLSRTDLSASTSAVVLGAVARSALATLTLSSATIRGPPAAASLAAALAPDGPLRELVLDSCELDSDVMRSLAGALPTAPLERLSLAGNELLEADVVDLALALAPALHEPAHISRPKVGVDFQRFLHGNARRANALVALSLQSTNISTAAARSVCRAWKLPMTLPDGSPSLALLDNPGLSGVHPTSCVLDSPTNFDCFA